jgi:hypothetical protein
MKPVNVLLFPVGEVPRLHEVPSSELVGLQALVGGLVQHVPLREGLGLWRNEKGRLLDLSPNRVIPGVDLIHGPFFLAAEDASGELVSIEPRDVTPIFSSLAVFQNRAAAELGWT